MEAINSQNVLKTCKCPREEESWSDYTLCSEGRD